jgi:hypothetical protein
MRLPLQAGRVVTVVLGLAVTAAFVALTAGRAQAAGSYDNAAIADRALQYVGRWGGEACRDAGKLDNGNTGRTVGGYGAGQCKTFVNCVVWLASGHQQYPGGGYSSAFKAAGGAEVTRAGATKGDIIQVGESPGEYLHTAIVVRNKGDGIYSVVDANRPDPGEPVRPDDEKVRLHDWAPPVNARLWRMGTISPTAPPEAQAPRIASTSTYQEGVLVYVRTDYTDANGDADGFGFRWQWGTESHPFADPSFGRVSAGRVDYPFNLGCGQPNENAVDVQMWIYDRSGLTSSPVTVHVGCRRGS